MGLRDGCDYRPGGSLAVCNGRAQAGKAAMRRLEERPKYNQEAQDKYAGGVLRSNGRIRGG